MKLKKIKKNIEKINYDKISLEIFSIRSFPEIMEAIDLFVEGSNDRFDNRSHFIRSAVVQKLRKEVEEYELLQRAKRCKKGY